MEGLAINPDYENWNPALSIEKPALLATAGSAAAPRGAQPAAPALPPPKHPPTGPQWKHLTITVNALLSGFGLKGADGKWYGYHTDVYFNTQTGQIVDAWSQSLGAQLEVVLDPIPGGEIPFEFSPVELTAGIQEPGSDPTVYGKFLSFTGVTGAGVTLPQDLADLHFAIPWTLNDYVAKVRVELAGQVLLEADPLKYPTPGMCSTTEPLVGEWGLYDLTLPYPTTLAAGLHELKVIVKLKTGAEVTRALKLRFVDAPAWFRTSAASQRWAGWDEVNEAGKWKVVGYKLREDLVAADKQAVDASSTLADTPNSGPVTNRATLSSSHIERIGFGGDIIATAESKAAKMTALNQSAKDREDKAWAQPTAPISIQSTSAPDSGYTIPIDYGPVELYNTGTLPLFAGAFTLWEIVQVTYVGVGGSSANLSMNGSVTVGDAPSIDLTMMPDARVWGTCTLGASFLAVVAAVKAELSADLNARLKLRVHDYDVDVNGVCFTYQGGNRFWAGLICVPGTEICVLDDEKRITWPPFQAGSCSGAAQAAALAAPTASPPTVGAALASDGFGHNAVLWPGDRSALTAAFYDGATWSATHTIPTGLGPVAPALAFFAPDRAIAAWAESSLPPSTNELPASAYNDVLRSYHIATSVWDGSAWSAPQDLTLPTIPGTGEGKVTLAACPATAAGCPAGGAVTAVWVRDVAGDSALRQFRLYYATYQDGHWSAPLPVDASSTGTDMQPSVAYRLGKPVVAWVRDADRSLDTVADRRIAWRVLDGASPAVVPAGLPEGIVYIDLSVDSAGVPQLAFTRVDAPGVSLLDSRHPLHYAWGACTGATCTWSWQKLQDSHGRTLQAEQPRLTSTSSTVPPSPTGRWASAPTRRPARSHTRRTRPA